jgi:hypothetical protein
MRRALLVLLAPIVFSAAAVAQTQVVANNTPDAVLAKVGPDEVVSRLLSFDRDHDGRIAKSELAERMQPMLTRADTNRDGALDAAEIRAIASAPPEPVVVQGRSGGGGFPVGRTYGFADDTSFSSRNHIDGAIEDLKLAADTKDRALAIAKAYVDGIEADAEANLMKDLNGVLAPEQLTALQETLETYPLAVLVIRSKDGTVTRETVARAVNIQPHINALRLTPDTRPLAQAAADRYTARLRMGEAERVALVDRLKGVLDKEERADLRAALVRRPVVPTGGPVAFAGRIEALKRERLIEGIEGTVSLEVNSPQER